MKHIPKLIKKAIYFDLAIIFIFNLLFLVFFSRIDLFELLNVYTQQHENYELDEVIPLFFTLSISLTVFATRRVIELVELVAKTEELSLRDPLTELYNRRYIREVFYNELDRNRRNKTQLAIVMIDIDDFKQINDTYGHHAGDQTLIQVSKLILSVCREVDIVSRWGGEEFLILCPETNSSQGQLVSERLLAIINSHEFSDIKDVTISIGVVCSNLGESFEAIVNRADDCMYKAKNNGKNGYVSA
ncbi:MAG: GGDEF domain-containing protein [Pseudomonas sp.]|nr:GGDEF domain-containing protein [Pseudomonas sp.]